MRHQFPQVTMNLRSKVLRKGTVTFRRNDFVFMNACWFKICQVNLRYFEFRPPLLKLLMEVDL